MLLLVDRDEASLAAAGEDLVATRPGAARRDVRPRHQGQRDGLARLAARAERARPAARGGACRRCLANHGRLARGADGRPRGHGACSSTRCGRWPSTARPSCALRRSRRRSPFPTSINPPTRCSTTRCTPISSIACERPSGPTSRTPGMAYTWAKRGVHRLVRREAASFGRLGARICSVTPGIIDTPMGRQEADTHEVMAMLVRASALGREGRARRGGRWGRVPALRRGRYVTGVDLTVDGGVIAAVRSGGLSSL